MNEEEKQKLLNDLYIRRRLAQVAIRTLESVDDSDERKKGALQEYREQLAKIQARIDEIENKPAPIVIGLKPGIISAKSEGIGGKR